MERYGVRSVRARARDGTLIAADVLDPPGLARATILLVAGLGYGPWSWRPQQSDLGTDHRLVLLHNRGTGSSGAPPGPYSVGVMADDAAAVVRVVGEGPVHVIGASMGGYIALQLAASHPGLVASAIVIASSPGGSMALGVPQDTSALWEKSAHLSGPDFARRTMPLSFADGWPEAHRDRYEALLTARLASPTRPSAWAAQAAACREFLLSGYSGTVPQRAVTGIHGTADRVVPYENLAVLGERLPQAKLITLEGAGHLCWLERPGDVNRLVRDHLGRAGGGSREESADDHVEEPC